MKKILLDTDIGCDTDDLTALTYLLNQPECEIKGVMTVCGESQKRAAIVGAVCNIMNVDIPVFAGCESDLMLNVFGGPLYNNQPLWDSFPGEHKYPNLPKGLKYFRDVIVENPNEIILVCIGPLTDIAMLFAIYPETVSLLKEVLIMGGNFFGNPRCTWDITSESNIRCDALAAKCVLEAPVKSMTVFGVDLTWDFQLTREQVCDILRPNEQLKYIYDVFHMPEEGFIYWFHDPLTVASLFLPEYGNYVKGNITVELSKEKWGVTTFTPDENSNCRVCRSFPKDVYFKHHIDVINKTKS